MSENPNPKDPGQEARDAHALAIGKIVIAWNDFHEILGEMFAVIFGRKGWHQALASWHSIENDRAQRAMLAAVVSQKFKKTSREYKEIIWLIEKTNQMISDQRNSGIHTPLTMWASAWNQPPQMIPNVLFGNRRAQKLYGADLLKEFEHYERQIRSMFGFATALKFAITPRSLRRGRVTWPQRPQLLPRAPLQHPKALHR